MLKAVISETAALEVVAGQSFEVGVGKKGTLRTASGPWNAGHGTVLGLENHNFYNWRRGHSV